MYGYVYLTYLPQTDKFYIGQHKASQFDETYYGSGVSFVKDFKNTPKCDAKRIIIQECMTAEELNKAEEYWIDIYDAVNSSEFYNVSKGSTGLPYNRGLKFMYNQTTDDVIMVPECLISSFEAEGYRRGNRPRNSLQLQHMSDAKKKLTVMTDDNVVIYVKEEDIPVYLEKGYRKGRIATRPNQKEENRRWMHKDDKSVLVAQDNVNTYLEQGFKYGRSKFKQFVRKAPQYNCSKIGVSKDGKLKYINPDELEYYLSQGYVKGKGK